MTFGEATSFLMQTDYVKSYQGTLSIYDDNDKDNPVLMRTVTAPADYTDPDYDFGLDDLKNEYEAQGYEFEWDDIRTLVWKNPEANRFELHFKHKINDETKTGEVSRHISYLHGGWDEIHDPTIQTLTFTKTDKVDAVTGQTVSEGSWEPSSQSFPAVNAPEVAGYIPDSKTVPEQSISYAEGMSDVYTLVNYKQAVTATVNYWDQDTGKIFFTKTVSGADGSEIDFGFDPADKIDEFKSQGYSFISTEWFNGTEYQEGLNPMVFNIYFKHQKEQLTSPQTITLTSEFVDAGTGKAIPGRDPIVETMTLTLTGEKDLVDQTVTWDWDNIPSGTFESFELPDVEGYARPQKMSDPVSATWNSSPDQEITKTYEYSPIYRETVSIIDDDDKAVLQTLTAPDDRTDSSSDIGQAKALSGWLDKNYVLVSDNSEDQALQPYPAYNHFEIHVKHGTETNSESKTVTRTIHYVNAKTKESVKEDAVQTITASYSETVDLVNHNILSDELDASKGPYSFAEVDSPSIDHMKCLKPAVDAVTLSSYEDLKDSEVTVYYQPEETAAIHFIDDDNNSSLDAWSVEGVTGETIDFGAGRDPWQKIADLEAENYVLAEGKNDWASKSHTYSDSNCTFEVHFTHKKEPVSETKTSIYKITYEDEAGNILSQEPARDLSRKLTRTGTKDLVENQIKWDPAPSVTVDAIANPEIEGYLCKDGDSVPAHTLKYGDQEFDVVVRYQKCYEGTLKIIDDTTGTVLKTYSTGGKVTDPDYDFGEEADLSDYLNHGYDKVSDSYDGTLKWIPDQNEYEIHLKHHVSDQTSTQDVTRTIRYVDESGNPVAASVIQTITFDLDSKKDKAAGTVTETCTNSPQMFEEKDSPAIADMIPDQESVPAANVGWSKDIRNQTVTVTYQKVGKAGITFVDNDNSGQVIDSMQASGKGGTAITFEKDPEARIRELESQGYELVSSGWDPSAAFAKGETKTFTIHLKHQAKAYSEPRTYTEDITYIDAQTGQEIADAYHQSVTLTGTGTRDAVTGEITWTDKPSYTFPSAANPKIEGYKAPDWQEREYKVEFGGSSLQVVIPYEKAYSGSLTYYDDTDGTTLKTVSITDSLSDKADFGQAAQLRHYLDQGYVLVSDDSENQTLGWKKDNQYSIHLAHDSETVDQNQTVKRTITYTNALNESDTLAEPVVQSLVFQAQGVRDKVTGQIDWISTFANSYFDPVWSPVLKGYKCLTPLVPAEQVFFYPGMKDSTVNVRYQPETHAVIDFYDDTEGKVITYFGAYGLDGRPITFPVSPDRTIATLEDEGYQLISSSWKDGILYNPDGDNHFYVHFVHNTAPAAETKTVTRTIHYQDAATGKSVADDVRQTLTFDQTGTRDLVTGQTRWDPTPAQTFEAVPSPKVAGMKADQDSVAAKKIDLTDNPENEEVTIRYRQTVPASITYYDNTDKVKLDTDFVTGLPGSEIAFTENPEELIAAREKKHYKLVSNTWKAGSRFKADSDNAFEVHFVHDTENADQKKTVSVIYQFEDAETGKSLKDPVTKTADLIWKGTKDLVTGTVTMEKEPSASFEGWIAPAIDHYQPEKDDFAPESVKFSDNTLTVVMKYNREYNGWLTVIDDTTGKKLASRQIVNSLSPKADFGQQDLIDSCLKKGYELVSDGTSGKELEADDAGNHFEIHLKHKTENVSRSKAFSRTIRYTNLKTNRPAAPSRTDRLKLVQNGVKDDVTKETKWDEKASLTFEAVSSPEVPDMKCLKKEVEARTVYYESDPADFTVTVGYLPETEAAILFIDDDNNGSLLKTMTCEGVSKDLITFKEDPNQVTADLEAQNYVLKSSDWKDGTLFDPNGTNHFEVHVGHQTQKAEPEKGEYTWTIQFKDSADGSEIAPAQKQTYSYEKTGTKDLVTGHITWDAPAPHTFELRQPPVIDQYQIESSVLLNETASAEQPDPVTTIFYDRLYSAVLNIVDDTEHKTIASVSFKPSTSSTIRLNQKKRMAGYENQGYEYAGSNFDMESASQQLKWGSAPNVFELHLRHQMVPYSDQKTVKRTIRFINAKSGKAVSRNVVQTLTFDVKGTQNKVTGSIRYQSGTNPQTFDAITSPELPHFICLQPEVPSVTVEYDPDGMKDMELDVRYLAENHADLVFIDDDSPDGENILKTETAWGLDGDPVSFDADPGVLIEHFEKNHYVLVSNIYEKGVLFDDGSMPRFEVHLKHEKKPVQKEETVSRTIRFVNEKTGNDLADPLIQKAEFIQTGQHDLVTGETSWDPVDSKSWAAVVVPDFDGYTHEQKTVDLAVVSMGDADTAIVILYEPAQKPADEKPALPDSHPGHDGTRPSSAGWSATEGTNRTVQNSKASPSSSRTAPTSAITGFFGFLTSAAAAFAAGTSLFFERKKKK